MAEASVRLIECVFISLVFVNMIFYRFPALRARKLKVVVRRRTPPLIFVCAARGDCGHTSTLQRVMAFKSLMVEQKERTATAPSLA